MINNAFVRTDIIRIHKRIQIFVSNAMLDVTNVVYLQLIVQHVEK